jgi:glycosyltransferase involved in cell wall biosynthesis
MNSFKKALFIDHEYGMSGATVSLGYLLEAFRKKGISTYVLTPKGIQEQALFLSAGAECISSLFFGRNVLRLYLHFIDASPTLGFKGIVFVIKEFLKVLCGIWVVGKAILKIRPDLVYTNEYVSIQASIAGKLLCTPAAVHIRSRFVEGNFGLRRMLLSYAIAMCNDLVVAITEFEARQITRYVGKNPKIHVVGEFLDDKNFNQAEGPGEEKTQWGFPEKCRIVIMLGGIFSIKGTLDFIKAAEIVVERYGDVFFAVAGPQYHGQDDPYFIKCQELAASPRLKGRFTFLGVTKNNLSLIRCCDVLVSPNTKTHFSRPIIEAWACGKPVVATATEHTRILVEHGINGLIVDIGDCSGMADAIVRLLSDEALSRELGENGHAKARREFGSGENTRRIIDLCSEVVSRKAGSRTRNL